MRMTKRVARLVPDLGRLDPADQARILEQARWQVFVAERRQGAKLMPFVFLVAAFVLLAALPLTWIFTAFPDVHPVARILGVGLLSGLAAYAASTAHDIWYARFLAPAVHRLLQEKSSASKPNR